MNELYLIYSACKTVWGVDPKKTERTRPYPYARACFYKIAKQETDNTLNFIGSFLNKDHATVIHGIKKFEEYELVPDFIEQYAKCLELFIDLKEEISLKSANTEGALQEITQKIIHEHKGYERKIKDLQTENRNLTFSVMKLKTKNPEWLEPLINLPEDLKDELINTRIKPFLTMLKSRKHYVTK